MNTKIRYIHCPHCHKKVKWQQNNLYRPFCSKRCQLIDLNGWDNESYVIVDKTNNYHRDHNN